MRLDEGARDLLRRERGALHTAPAEGGAVAAGQRAGIGLHDPHEGGGAAPGDAHLPDAHRPLARRPGLADATARACRAPGRRRPPRKGWLVARLGPWVHLLRGHILNTRRVVKQRGGLCPAHENHGHRQRGALPPLHAPHVAGVPRAPDGRRHHLDRRGGERPRLHAGVRRGRRRVHPGLSGDPPQALAHRRGPALRGAALGADVPRRSRHQAPGRGCVRAVRARHRALGYRRQGRGPPALQALGRLHRPRRGLWQRRLGTLRRRGPRSPRPGSTWVAAAGTTR